MRFGPGNVRPCDGGGDDDDDDDDDDDNNNNNNIGDGIDFISWLGLILLQSGIGKGFPTVRY
jgi:hypothetical protein